MVRPFFQLVFLYKCPIVPSCFVVLPVIASKSVQISSQHGLSLSGAYMYTLYGTILIHNHQLVKEGYTFGRLAVKALEGNGDNPLACPILKVYASHIQVSSEVSL